MTVSNPTTTRLAIGDWLTEAAQRHPSSTLRIEDSSMTIHDLDDQASRVAAGFQALGLSSGDAVCLVMAASVESLQLWFGLARGGLIEVPLNPNSGTALLEYCIAQSDAQVVVCDAEHEALVRECIADNPVVRHLIVVGADSPTPQDGLQVMPYPDLLLHPIQELPAVDPMSTAVILYTSGTTGPPKGVKLSHRANINLAKHTTDLLGYTEHDRLYSVFPLYHSNARYCSVMAAIEVGADLVMHRKFSASKFWDTCREHGITAFNYQGAMMSILFKQPVQANDADNPVRIGFGAPCPPEIFQTFEERFNISLTEIYGSTEVSIVTDMPPWQREIGTAGKESANYQVAVVDDHENPVPAGTVGEIVARPKHAGWMFDGYHKMPEATAESWKNLWFHTGDRGYLNDDGYLTFVDRLKDTIRRRGENISSWEIERVISEHPSVSQVAAYGVPSELSEEDVMIAVVARDGQHVNPAELRDHCQGTLTSFAIPRYIRVVDELPMTPSQRVEKYKLRADGLTADTWDAQEHS